MPNFETLYSSELDTELGSNDSSVLFTTARRKHAINNGLKQFVDLTECLIRQSTVTVSSGVREYNLLSTAILPGGDFDRMAGQGPVYQLSDTAGNLQSVAGDDFPQRDVAWLDAAESGWRSTTLGTPTGWYLRRDPGALYFGLDRPPDWSTNQTAQLIIPYIPFVSTMTSTGDIPFVASGSTSPRTDLAPYHQALVHYAAHQLEKLRKDQQAADGQLKVFLGYVTRYVSAFRPKGPRGVRASKSYFRRARGQGREVGSPLAPWWR